MGIVKKLLVVVMIGMAFLSGGTKDLLGKAAKASPGGHEGSTHEGASCA